MPVIHPFGFGPLNLGGMLAMTDPGSLDARPSLVEPPARALRSVGDGAPHFASQIGAARTLVDRLNRDVVAHAPDDDRPEAA